MIGKHGSGPRRRDSGRQESIVFVLFVSLVSLINSIITIIIWNIIIIIIIIIIIVTITITIIIAVLFLRHEHTNHCFPLLPLALAHLVRVCCANVILDVVDTRAVAATLAFCVVCAAPWAWPRRGRRRRRAGGSGGGKSRPQSCRQGSSRSCARSCVHMRF
jgi:hypothetical protein